MTKTVQANPARLAAVDGRSAFLADVLDGLRRPRGRKAIPCKYFYDDRGSALFDRICELDEYYPTRVELAILRAHAPAMADAIGEDVELIELGSGSSVKTRLLLDRLAASRAYVPVDISAEHLARSAASLSGRYPSLRVFPVAADFTAPFALPATGDPKARRVVYFPGSTIGNFTPEAARALLRSIARLVGSGGGLLVGFDLEKDASILLPAYDDRRGVTAEFNLNLLARINRELGGDFDLDAFSHRATYAPEHERVEIHLISRRRQVATVAGAEFPFEDGEAILTEYSHKYSLDHIARMTFDAGFSLEDQWMDRQRYFSVQYLIAA